MNWSADGAWPSSAFAKGTRSRRSPTSSASIAQPCRAGSQPSAHGGATGLSGHAAPGRPRKLTTTQEKIVLRWLADNPTEHGFPTELWTTARLGRLIEQEFGVTFNPRYLSAWLRGRGLTPQKPQRVPRERDPDEIREWLSTDWPRIKKRRGVTGPISP
jgi:transposase